MDGRVAPVDIHGTEERVMNPITNRTLFVLTLPSLYFTVSANIVSTEPDGLDAFKFER